MPNPDSPDAASPGKPREPELHGLDPGELLARGLRPISVPQSVPQTEVLIFVEGQEVARYVLAPGAHVFGRSDECNVHVVAANVSREHARLTVSEDGTLLLE